MLPEILQRVHDHGFKVFDSDHDFDLNIVALRNPIGRTNKFDDLLFCVFKVDGQWIVNKYKVTTDPGHYWLHNPSRVEGTAILKHPQQCRSVYKLDLHRGKYLALCQRNGKVTVWRDSNRDSYHDFDVDEQRGYFGINIHRASKHRITENVDRYSAGCTVFADPEEFAVFIEACKMQVEHNGWKTFTYTILLGRIDDFDQE